MELHSALKRASVVALGAVFASGVVWAEVVSWTGGGKSDDWNTSANWDADRVPSVGDDVVIGTGGNVVFASGNLAVKSLSLSGATLTIGSSENRDNVSADIVGNLSLAGASKLYVYAGTFADRTCFANDATAAAAIYANANVIAVGGSFSVGDTSVVYPDNDRITGTPVFFRTKDFSLAVGASFNAVKRGWGWQGYTGTAPENARTEASKYYTYAMGAGLGFGSAGGAYGGNSYAKTTSGGKTFGYAYGCQYAPFLPGSPNGCHAGATVGSGSICIFATGNASVAGTLNANGEALNMYGAPSGGGIWLVAKTLTIAQTASFKAIGANTGYSSSGGGGRIAVGAGLSSAQIDSLASGAQPPELAYDTLQGVDASAAGGMYGNGAGYSPSGTLTLVADKTVSQPVLVKAEPVEYEKGTISPDYGFYAYEAADLPTFTAPAGTYPPYYQDRRRLVNKGYDTIDGAALRTIVWKWQNEECLLRIVPCGAGKVTVNGIDYAKPETLWIPAGTELTLVAAPDAGGSFERWVGDISGLTLDSSTITVTVDRSLSVNALFADASAAAKTYVGPDGGFWDVDANWSPVGIPSVSNDVTIAGKTVYCTGVAVARSLAQEGGALVLGGASSSVDKQTGRTDAFVAPVGLFVLYDMTVHGGAFSLGASRSAFTNIGARVCGDLSVSGASKVAFYASELAQADFAHLHAHAMRVSVGGAMSVSDTSVVYAEADGLTGTPVKFEVAGDVTVGEKASFSADARGWQWYTFDLAHPDTRPQVWHKDTIYTLAPGYGDSWSTGGAYGLSGTSDSEKRRPYGYLYAPFLPGSPAGNYNTSSRAGGQIWIEAAGTISLDGTLTACASKGSSTRSSASGGGIWLVAKKLAAGAKATLKANGGDGSGTGACSGGTGGRISVALGVSAADLDALAGGEQPDNLAYAETFAYGTASVAGGWNRSASGVNYYAPNGTVSTVIGEVTEYNLVVQANPVAARADNLEYTTLLVTKGADWSWTIGSAGFDPANPSTVRYTCQGWVISNTTEAVASGMGTTASFTVGKGPFTLTWQWGARETLAKVVPNDPALGGVSVNGAAATPTADVWTSDTGTVRLTAVANDDAEFLYWYGDAAAGGATNATVEFDTAVPFGLKPVFRTKAEPTNCVWKVADKKTGLWEDASNWDPANVPGREDTVTIATGTCLASNYVVCANLILSGNGSLKVGTAATPLLKETAVVVSGGVSLSGNSTLTLNDERGTDLRHPRLLVGSGLTLNDNAVLKIGAGPTNGVDVTLASGAGWLTVAGDLKLLGSSTLWLKGDPWTGGSMLVRAGSLFVAEGATLSAVGGGYATLSSKDPVSYSLGRGLNHSVGGGYGGRGTTLDSNFGLTYGLELSPIHPGSEMGDYRMGYDYRGGGLVRVHATGSVQVDGTVDASANMLTYNNSSGGGIWLTAGTTLKVGKTALFKARGGTGATTGAGGGGRISLCRVTSPEQAAQMAADGRYHGPGRSRDHVFGLDRFQQEYAGAQVDLTNGKVSSDEPYVGTFRYVDGTARGLSLIVR